VEEGLAPGSRIGTYEVIDRLGAGGMGEVYRARDTRLGRTVALKVLRSGADPDLLHRLDREARAASALNHPNIVHIYDVGEAPAEAGAHYVVMEYVEGETLRRRLAGGPLPLDAVLDLGAQLTDGLAKAHRAGILHRDLKPENVMVTADGLLKILDFGLAKLMVTPLGDLEGETLSRHETRAGTLLGTLEYMSPEQASGRPVDHRTDQFSVGLILHEMTTGRRVFRRDTPAQVLAAVIERDAEPLSRLRADVPPAFEALVSRCLQKDPERRFAKTDELASEVAALAGRSRSGSRTEAAVPSGGAAVSVEVIPAPPPAASSVYHVQEDERVRTYDEKKLADLLRRGKLTGAELARRDDEEKWQPLFESRVYRLTVPTTGDPRDAARQRVLNGVAGHFMGFFITGVVMVATQGHFPFWMWIWAAVLFVQALGAAPAALSLWQRRQTGSDPGAQRPPLPVIAAAPPPLPPVPRLAGGVPSAIAEEGARVRALIEQRGGKDVAALIAEVDRILSLTADLAAREADLQEQTTERERAALDKAIAEATARLDRAELAQDRQLFERQLQVLQSRQEGIAKAVLVLERLRVRREMAEHQLKQLRLDLSRGAARGLDAPELSSRLEFIRYEVDAREEVDEIRADRA
jgi:serine/threonine protein kinase